MENSSTVSKRLGMKMFRINDCIKFEDKEYVISRFIGQGGMGHVFLIEERAGDSKFALKSLQHYLPDRKTPTSPARAETPA